MGKKIKNSTAPKEKSNLSEFYDINRSCSIHQLPIFNILNPIVYLGQIQHSFNVQKLYTDFLNIGFTMKMFEMNRQYWKSIAIETQKSLK